MSQDNVAPSSMEELLAIHRKQKKELQAQIQALKKSVSKGDKARLKQTQKKIKEMETELTIFQQKEIDTFNEKEPNIDAVSSKVNNINLENGSKAKSQPKVSKAQKLREKKEAKARELTARLALAESNYTSSERYIEETKIKEKLSLLGLAIKEVPSDGNCLYSAVQHQLDDKSSVVDLRMQTACYIRQHKNDFLPFLISNNTASVMTDNEFDSYCSDIEKPSTWGGQIELLALSHLLSRPVHVIQADSDTTVHGEQYSENEPIILIYYIHQFGLGEHYNSITKLNPNP